VGYSKNMEELGIGLLDWLILAARERRDERRRPVVGRALE
jgi:hypothetical protein